MEIKDTEDRCRCGQHWAYKSAGHYACSCGSFINPYDPPLPTVTVISAFESRDGDYVWTSWEGIVQVENVQHHVDHTSFVMQDSIGIVYVHNCLPMIRIVWPPGSEK